MDIPFSNRCADSFLLECSRSCFKQAAAAEAGVAFTRSDWEIITDRAIWHQFAGILDSCRRQGKLPGVPPEAAVARWKQAVVQQALLQVVYEAEGSRLLSGMAEKGIEPVLLKGFAYMQDLYGDSAARSISDMDILIRRDELTVVKQYFQQEGYDLCVSDFYADHRAEFERFQADFNYEASFMKTVRGQKIVIDVHWQMGAGWPGYEHLSIFALDRISWREITEPFSFSGNPARRLNLTAHFFHLMTHFALHHRFSGLKWMHELCLFMFMNEDRLDWDLIEKYAGETGCRKIVGATLRLVADCLGRESSAAGRWKSFWPHFLPGEFALFRNRLFKEESQLTGAVCLLLLIARFRDRIRLIGFLLFDPRGIPQLRLSSSAYRLPRRILQPFFLAGLATAAIWRRGKKQPIKANSPDQ